MKRFVTLALAASVLTSAMCACGEETATDDVIASLAEDLAKCPEPGRMGERPPLAEVLVDETRRWLRVEKVLVQDTESDINTLGPPSQLLVVDPASQSEPFEVWARVNWSYWPGITWAVDNGAEVWLAIADETSWEGPNPVLLTMLVLPEGRVFFPGYCAQENVYAELQEEYGANLDDVMRSAVGETGDELAAILGVGEAKADGQHVFLNPDQVPPEELQALRFASLHVTVSRPLGDEFTVCTKVAVGWNDCLVPDGVATEWGYVVDAYLDGSDLEFWLLDGAAQVDDPIARLGTIVLPADFSDKDVALRVEIDFDDDPSEAAVRLVEAIPLHDLDPSEESWSAFRHNNSSREATSGHE